MCFCCFQKKKKNTSGTIQNTKASKNDQKPEIKLTGSKANGILLKIIFNTKIHF